MEKKKIKARLEVENFSGQIPISDRARFNELCFFKQQSSCKFNHFSLLKSVDANMNNITAAEQVTCCCCKTKGASAFSIQI